MPRRATKSVLSEQEQEALLQLTRRQRSEQQVVLRARSVGAAAEGRSNAQIARALDSTRDTVRRWRDRWASRQGIDQEPVSVAERVQEAPRPGVAPTFSAEPRAQLAALAWEAPPKRDVRSGAWTGRAIVDEWLARGSVAQISPRHAARLLKKGASSRTGSAPG